MLGNFTYCNPTKLYFGEQSLEGLHKELPKYGDRVVLIYGGGSIKRNGVGGWLKGFTEPIVVMTPMNLVSEIAQPISMAFRHFGNIVSGSVITALVYAALIVANRALFGIIPGIIGKWLGAIPFLTVGVPAVISLYFDWFGSFMQAFIFCMLTMMYISTATD